MATYQPSQCVALRCGACSSVDMLRIFCFHLRYIRSRFRQPQVVGEMIAGVILGPSLFGLLLPMFFTYSGINTRLDMVNSVELLLIALVILAASIVAEFGAC